MAEKDVKFTVMTVNDWHTRWQNRRIGFHKDTVHLLLEKHLDKLIYGRENIKIFFPLCGKAVDMKWLADKGHTIIGVDGSDIGLKEFFEEQKLAYSSKEVPELKATLFTSEDGRIRLYCCDFFSFNSDVEGLMDAIWDRGSLVAVNRTDRKKYSDKIKSLMNADCRYILSTVQYDETKYPGPPHNVSDELIPELYGDACNIENIECVDSFEEKHKGWNLDAFHETVHLLTLKST